MSHWNHRVCKETISGGLSPEPLVTYTIREVYYNDANEVTGVTERFGEHARGIDVYADNEYFPPEETPPTEEQILAEMSETIERFKKALEKPILDLDNITYGDWDK